MKNSVRYTQKEVSAEVERIVRESKRFPIPIDQIQKEIARRTFPQSRGQLEVVLDTLIVQNRVMVFREKPEIRYFHIEMFDAVQVRMEERTRRYHAQHPERPGITRKELRASIFDRSGGNVQRSIDAGVFEQALLSLSESRRLVIDDSIIRLPGFTRKVSLERPIEVFAGHCVAIRDMFLKDRYVRINVEKMAFRFRVGRTEVLSCLNRLIQAQAVIRIEKDRYITSEYFMEILDCLAEAFDRRDRLFITEIAEILGLSRKTTSPLLDFLDKSGVTVRSGDYRTMNSEKVRAPRLNMN